jgi:Cft2 family RNA processing exonuclease
MHFSAEAIIETVRHDGNVLLPVDTAARVLEILLWLNEVGRALLRVTSDVFYTDIVTVGKG